MSTDKVTISLFPIKDDHLILLSPNGIWYSNQTGGTLCAQPRAKGHLVPLSTGFTPGPHDAYEKVRDFWAPLNKIRARAMDLVGPGSMYPWLRFMTAPEIAISSHLLGDQKHFGEAWLPVVIEELPTLEWGDPLSLGKDEPSQDLKGARAILTWENSD